MYIWLVWGGRGSSKQKPIGFAILFTAYLYLTRLMFVDWFQVGFEIKTDAPVMIFEPYANIFFSSRKMPQWASWLLPGSTYDFTPFKNWSFGPIKGRVASLFSRKVTYPKLILKSRSPLGGKNLRNWKLFPSFSTAWDFNVLRCLQETACY